MLQMMIVLVGLSTTQSGPKDYAACRKAVESGQKVTLGVGVGKFGYADYHTDKLEGTADNIYICYKRDGKEMMEPYSNQLPAGTVVQETGLLGSPQTSLAQSKAETQARTGGCYHPGGGFGGGTKEGCGFSSVSADHAIRSSCFWGKATPIDIGVARGSHGWHACVIYR